VGLFVNSWGYTGSATLVAPDWVLTAAHTLSAANSATFTLNGTSYASSRFVVHPGWTGDAALGYDIALVQLSSPVSGITPARLYSGTSEQGQVGLFGGFGFTGTGLTGWVMGNTQKLAFENVIDGDFGNANLILGCDFDNPHSAADSAFGATAPLPFEGCVAPGDSGGAMFLPGDQEYYLAGVISFVAGSDGNGNSDYGDVTGFARVSTFTPWILANIPEPSSGTLLLLGAILVTLTRRKPAR
jgi:secreted trypsin-like serine protease